MIEKTYSLAKGDEKVIERVVIDENINYNHMILPKDDHLPHHSSNSNVYMTVVRGTVSLGLDDQEPHLYKAGTIIYIPQGIKMDVLNGGNNTLELFVVKSPAPNA